MVLSRAAWAILTIAAVGACGSDNATLDLGSPEGGMVYLPPKPNKDGGLDSDAGSKVGPIVTVMTPPPSSDPAAGPVLSGASVDVKCSAVQRDKIAPVDPTKVEIWVYASGVIDPLLKVPAALQGTDVYGASVALDSVPTGGVRFRCQAADKASVVQTGYGEVTTFYDAGPKITFTNLNDTSIIARGTDTNTDLSIQFKVEAGRLAANDSAADVSVVTLSINGLETSMPLSADGNYVHNVDFLGLFDGSPIASVTLLVTAKNSRGSPPTTSKKQLLVKVDGDGPSVVFTAPSAANGAPIVGGTVFVQMTINDELAGVAVGSDKVYAQIPATPAAKTYAVTAGPNNSYSFTFEAGEFSDTSTIVPQVHAFDKAGNHSVATFILHLDTVAPFVSLAPDPVRACTTSNMTCSKSFSVLGDSPRDGQVIAKEERFRALVWEQGIVIDGARQIWVAGVRDESVTFYAQADPLVPLLRNTDNDPECDEINNQASLTPAQAPFVTALNRVDVSGSMVPTDSPELSADPPAPGGWLPYTGVQPMLRCPTSEMYQVVAHTMPGNPPVVYASEPSRACTGVSFSINLRGGWTCIAVAARDLAGAQGNLGLSKPIRVCREVSGNDCPKTKFAEPPSTLSCTDGCKLPAGTLTNPIKGVPLVYP